MKLGRVMSVRQIVMKLGRVMSFWRTVMNLGRVVSVHGEQTQLQLLEKTHQSNGNLRKNDSVLMPKGEFKLASNLDPTRLGARRRWRVRVCGEPSVS